MHDDINSKFSLYLVPDDFSELILCQLLIYNRQLTARFPVDTSLFKKSRYECTMLMAVL